jgi:hypothetical protein
MALDNTKNFAKSTVSAGYDNLATSIVLSTGGGAKFPTPPFNAVWWNVTDYSDPSDDPNVEIVRVTAISGDTLTITRGQEGTSANNHNISGKIYMLIAGLTSKLVKDIYEHRQNIQTSPTSITPDKSQYDEYYVTALANAITINNATSPSVGDTFVIYLTDNGTARSISYGTNYAAIGAALPTTTIANKTMEIIIKYVTTTKALVSFTNQQ